jgi:hypothetical protein
MGKEYFEFINYSVEEFRKKTMGRYFVLSWTPVRSIHNPRRCQVRYRRWKPGDRYVDPMPVADVIVTKPLGAKMPVVTRREEQVAVAQKYEETVKLNGKVEKIGGGYGLFALVIGIFIIAWLLLMGRK